MREAEQQRHTAETVEEWLVELIYEAQEDGASGCGYEDPETGEAGGCFGAESSIERADKFGDSGLLTRDRGILLRLGDGTEFQISIVQSR